MKGARRAFASRANSKKSTGPKTAAGKAVVARNAHRHGLNLPVLDDPALSPEIDDVARKIVTPLIGAEPKGRQHELACRIAEPTIDLRRVREAKLPLISALQTDPSNSAALKQLVALDRYERRALSRRKFAIRQFCAASLAQVDDGTGAPAKAVVDSKPAAAGEVSAAAAGILAKQS